MIFIEGIAFPIGKKNANGWGIPESEVDNAINSLKSSVVRICSRDDPHGCDVTEDPKAEIGNVVAAWREGDVVKTRAAITDSTASQKIADKTWKNTWSIYGKAPKVVDGWPTNFNARSLALVQNPAWEDTVWNIAASEGSDTVLKTFSEFTLISSQNEEGDSITKELEDKIKTLETQLSAAAKTCEEKPKEMTAKMDEMNKTTSVQAATIEELTASEVTLENELGEKTTLAASLEIKKTGLLTRDEAQTLVAFAIDNHIEEQKRKESFAKLEAARKDLGLETKAEDYKVLTASDIDRQTEEFSKIKLTSSGPNPVYPANGTAQTNTSCTGAYDAKTGEWK